MTLAIPRCCFAENSKEISTKMYGALAEPLYRLLKAIVLRRLFFRCRRDPFLISPDMFRPSVNTVHIKMFRSSVNTV